MSRRNSATLGVVFTLIGLTLGGVGGFAAYLYLTETAAERADCTEGPFCGDQEYQVVMGVGALGLIFLLFGLLAWVRFLREGRQIERIKDAGVEVEGMIVQVKGGHTRVNRQVVMTHVIEFDGPDGPVRFEHRETRLGYPGDKVMVRYDPENPSSARLSQVWLRSWHASKAHRAKYGFLGQEEIFGMKFELADLVPRNDPQGGPASPNPANPQTDEHLCGLMEKLSRGEITRHDYSAAAAERLQQLETAGPPPGTIELAADPSARPSPQVDDAALQAWYQEMGQRVARGEITKGQYKAAVQEHAQRMQ